MTVDESKCHFGYEEKELLGYRVNRLGLSTQPQKVKAITDLPFPRTVKHGHQVVGDNSIIIENSSKPTPKSPEPLTTALSYKSKSSNSKVAAKSDIIDSSEKEERVSTVLHQSIP